MSRLDFLFPYSLLRGVVAPVVCLGMTTQPRYYTDMDVEPVDVWDQQGIIFQASIAMCTKYVMRNGLKSEDEHDLDGLVFFALVARYGLSTARDMRSAISTWNDAPPHTGAFARMMAEQMGIQETESCESAEGQPSTDQASRLLRVPAGCTSPDRL